MRVLFLTLWYPNDENPILGTFVHEQADALRQCGVELKIVQPIPRTPFPTTLIEQRYRRLSRIPTAEIYKGFEVSHPRYLTLPRHVLFEHVGAWLYGGVRERLSKIASQWPFDIIHAHTTYPCGYAANLLRERDLPGVKVVHTIHRTDIIDAPRYSDRCRQKVRQALQGADRNIFVSRETQGLAADIAGQAIDLKSDYITNGVTPANFDLDESDRAEVARMRIQYSNTWNLVFVGYLSERKGVRELLAAVKRLVDVGRRQLRLFLVGRNEFGSYVQDFVREARMGHVVNVPGPVLHERVKIWMHFADGFILPSHSEGLPTVLFEALYARAPSIFTRVGGVEDIVTDGREALLISPHSTHAIEQAITHLMDNPAASRAMGERGHRLVCADFTWAHNARRHVELYGRLVARSKPRRAERAEVSVP
jgi:teichuronic acid biosynthesis glycosyltransferase TuaC